jgi:acetylornithine deacetylase/succinyl-diaminopimelate desuccinylase-like protein
MRTGTRGPRWRYPAAVTDAEHPERQAVAGLAEKYTDRLSEWLTIPSVSADPAQHGDVARSARFLADWLRAEGWPTVAVWESDDAPLPAVYGCWPADDPGAPTVLIYGHHDVQPVDPIEAWRYPPFAGTVVGDELFGRGASDDKGQVAMMLLGLRAHLAATGRTAPAVTVKLFVEGEEESGSRHLRQLLDANRAELACDLIIWSDTPLYGRTTPSVCLGQRGVVGAEIVFTGGQTDAHSGRVGGAIPNPATALARLVAALHDENGRVAMPGFYDDVRQPTVQERADFAQLPFDQASWLAGAAGGALGLAGEAGWSTLERVWVRPTAEVNGIHGGYTGPGGKTIVPSSATVKLSFRLVPDQQPARVGELLRDFVATHTPEGIEADVRLDHGVAPYSADQEHPATLAVRDALSAAFDTEARFSRTGGSGPASLLHEVIGAPLVYLSGTLPDDQIHAPNERVVLPVLHQGAEAAAILLRLLPHRLARSSA